MFGQGQTVAHDATCQHCGAAGLKPMAHAMLYRRRFMWACPTCQGVNTQRLNRRTAERLKLTFHRVYGTRISPEELQEFHDNIDRLDDAVRDLL